MILPKQAAPVQRGNSTRVRLPSSSGVDPSVVVLPWKFDCKKYNYKDEQGKNQTVHIMRMKIAGQPPTITEWDCLPSSPAGK